MCAPHEDSAYALWRRTRHWNGRSHVPGAFWQRRHADSPQSSRNCPWLPSRGGNDHLTTQHYVAAEWPQPPNYYDIFVAGLCCNIATTRLILQTAVAVLPVREPVVLAKQAATLDLMSGRLILGVGIGAYREEFEAVRPEAHGWHRGQMVDEGMQALRVLLRERRATLPGATCAFATSKCSRNHAKTRCPSGSVAILTTAWCEPLPTVAAG